MEFNAIPRDDGGEANQDGVEISSPGDAESIALEGGVHEIDRPAQDERDDGALSGPPESTRPEANGRTDQDEARAAGYTSEHDMHPAREAVGDGAPEAAESQPTRGRVEETVPQEQQAFWIGLAQASEQAGRAAHVRENAPNSDDALEHEYHQYQLFGAVQAYNEAGAQSLFGVASSQVAAAAAARREAEASGVQAREITDETKAQSADGTVRILGRQVEDEEAQILLSDGARASFAIPEGMQTEGSSVFSVVTRQTVAQHVPDGAEETTPITLDVTNEFIVHGDDPGIAHWTNLTMNTVRDGTSDDEYFDRLTGRILTPMIVNGIPDEPEGADPSMKDTFFRTLDAIGINSALTQVGSTELASEASDNTDGEHKLFSALEHAGYTPEKADTHDGSAQAEAPDDAITEAQAKVVAEAVGALYYFDYDSNDQDVVESMSNALANYSQVAARTGDWETVAVCRERLDEMEQNEFSQLSATARVLLHQQELGLDIQAAEDLRTRLQAERQQDSVQPLLDTVIEECEALGISPEPWIKQYAADNEDAFRRTMDHYAYTHEPGLEDAADARLSTMAASLLEDTSFSAEFVCEMVPTAIANVDDRNLQVRLMDRYLERLEDADMSPHEYSRLVEMGGHSIAQLQNAYARQAAALDTVDQGALARTEHDATVGRQLVERYDEAIARALLQLGSQGQLTYESAMTQMYWAQELPQFGIEPNTGVPNLSVDGMIKEISENMNSLYKRDSDGNERPSRASVINYRDSVFHRLASVAAERGAFGDCRKIINAMAPMNQARAYVHFWGQATKHTQLDSLDPELNVDPAMRPFEVQFNGHLAGLRSHYNVSRYLLEADDFELSTRDTAETSADNPSRAEMRHNMQLSTHGRAVGRTLARLLPRAGEPARPLSPGIPLYRTQLNQMLDRLGENDPDMQAALARGLLQDTLIRDTGDKELTFTLAEKLARTGDPADYAAAREAIVGIRGGIKDNEKRQYKLQLVEAYSEALAA
jgi:hypothetical protein